MKSRLKRKSLTAGLLLAVGLVIFLVIYVYFTIGPSFPCLAPANGHVQPGISSRNLTSGETQRCYLLYVPTDYDPAQPIHVVFALHGFAGNAQGLRSISVWEPVAEREKFLVVYPDGSSFPLRWNVGPVANIPTIDDVQLIRDVIANHSSIASVDKERIYVTGFSNGGQMIHRIGCQLADQVTAIGIVEGFDPGMLEECSPSRPVPVIAFFGTANPLAETTYPEWFLKLVDVSTETESPLPANAIQIWLENWAQHNGCDLSIESIPPIGNASGIRYGICQDNAEVALYWIEWQGHAWPGGPSLSFLGESVSDINASETMWEFFRKYSLNNAP